MIRVRRRRPPMTAKKLVPATSRCDIPEAVVTANKKQQSSGGARTTVAATASSGGGVSQIQRGKVTFNAIQSSADSEVVALRASHENDDEVTIWEV